MLLLGFEDPSLSHQIIALAIAFVTGVLSPLVTHWARNKFAPKKNIIEEEETDEILKLLKANEVIDNKIEAFRQEHNLDRVWIAQFHNGGSFYPVEGVFKFQKFSLTYEACRPGIASDLSAIQNIPVSVFSTLLKKVKEVNFYSVEDISAAQEEGTVLKSFWADRGVKGFQISAIKCLNKKFLGFIVVDSITGNTPLTQKLGENLMLEARILGGYLVKNEPLN